MFESTEHMVLQVQVVTLRVFIFRLKSKKCNWHKKHITYELQLLNRRNRLIKNIPVINTIETHSLPYCITNILCFTISILLYFILYYHFYCKEITIRKSIIMHLAYIILIYVKIINLVKILFITHICICIIIYFVVD